LKKFLFLVTAAILNGGRSEQKVTTLDKDLARNISAKYGSNPSSGSLKDLLRYYMEDGIENCHELSLQTANQVLLLFGPIENPRWPPAGAEKKIIKNFSQSEAFMAPGSHVG
jgi:hypothetical protein